MEKQLAELQASETSLKKAKAALESRLSDCEVLLASTTATKEEVEGESDHHAVYAVNSTLVTLVYSTQSCSIAVSCKV